PHVPRRPRLPLSAAGYPATRRSRVLMGTEVEGVVPTLIRSTLPVPNTSFAQMGAVARRSSYVPVSAGCTVPKCRDGSDLRVSVTRLRGPVVLVDHAAEDLPALQRRT